MVRGYLALASAIALLAMGVAGAAGGVLSQPVVEGHSTFVSITIEHPDPPPILGLAVCHRRVEVPNILWDLVDILSGCADEVTAVFATPLPFSAPGPDAVLTETGRLRTVKDYEGFAWTTREYTFDSPSGPGITWVVETAAPLRHPNGEEYNFLLAPLRPPAGVPFETLVLTPGPAP